MKWSFLYNDFKPEKKNMAWPAVLAAGIAATGATANNLMSGSYSDHAAKENRKWQEAMYEKYYSPQAQMRQYRAAGVNPLLMSQGSGLSAQSMPQGQQAVTPNFENVGEAAVRGYSDYTQMELNAATSSNQRSESILNQVRAVNEAYINGGLDAGNNMLNQLMPLFKTLGMDSHQVMLQTADARLSARCKAICDSIESDWQKEFGKQFRSTQFMQLNQEISNLVGQTNVLQTQGEYNRAAAAELGSRIGRNIAEAWNLKKVGEYYEVSVSTARQIQDYVVSQALLQNGLSAVEFLRDNVAYGNESAAAELKRAIASNPWLQYTQWGLEALGNVVHVGVGANFNMGSSKSMVESINRVTTNSNVRVHSTSSNTNSNFNTNQNFNTYLNGSR